MELLLLPLKLAFWLVFGIFLLPFLLLRLALKVLMAVIVLPFVLVFAFVGVLLACLALAFALLAPLLPFAVIALLIYALMRHSPAATAVRG
jgi:hypothetical protein